eukprot:CAMPEP_0116875630 /NCGR_PEP_ID=MMETSP0463-20121206/7665_1 /TAXON_ID=181622 /ORGANISM="Strombidinopsis sp, Strain SopsisLIS2011" /LENGTH=31 /DNA_ID= /DNA_START= /DNA_END= /DNA_ORIENTATION=
MAFMMKRVEIMEDNHHEQKNLTSIDNNPYIN